MHDKKGSVRIGFRELIQLILVLLAFSAVYIAWKLVKRLVAV